MRTADVIRGSHKPRTSCAPNAGSARGRLSRGLGLLALLILTLGIAFGNVRADNDSDRRMRSAARLMRALLAADEGIGSGGSPESTIQVLILADTELRAEPLAELIAPSGDAQQARVSGHRLDVAIQLQLPTEATGRPDAIFLAESLSDEEFRALLDWCIARRVILYSPFDGDVERGATAGLSIQAKVQPFINSETLAASGITLRTFFVEHSRVWP